MQFAVIGDIHSNLEALKRVLEDIGRRGVDFILSTGDLVGYAPFPNEVIELLRKAHVLCIQGNYDRAIGHRELVCGCDYTDSKQLELAARSVKFTNLTVTESNRAFLKSLPESLRILGNLNILVVHGSPRRNNEYLFEDSLALAEVTQEIVDDILICGHTHIPFHKIVNGKHVVNAGSVGKPKHGNANATYVIVELVEDNVRVDIIEVPYDVERTAQAIEAEEMLPDEFARILRC